MPKLLALPAAGGPVVSSSAANPLEVVLFVCFGASFFGNAGKYLNTRTRDVTGKRHVTRLRCGFALGTLLVRSLFAICLHGVFYLFFYASEQLYFQTSRLEDERVRAAVTH